MAKKRTLEEIKEVYKTSIYDIAPKGWIKTEGATTAPNGFEWFNNGESLFSGKRKSCLVRLN